MKRPPEREPLRDVIPRAAKKPRVTTDPVLPCEVEGKIKDRSDAAKLREHLQAIQAHREKYEKRLQEEPDVSAHKGKITEAKGEHEATLLMIQRYPDYEIIWDFAAGTGIDQLWYNKSTDTYIMVEAKGPGATLSTGAAKGDQMTLEWVRNSLTEVKNSKSSNDEDRQRAEKMLNAMDNGPSPQVLGRVIEAKEDGGAEEKPCPDGGIYHAQ
jgi:hypothetical protein